VTAEAVKILKVIEKERSDVSFDIEEQLLGGVCSSTGAETVKLT
jgi:hypothetical protein